MKTIMYHGGIKGVPILENNFEKIAVLESFVSIMYYNNILKDLGDRKPFKKIGLLI